MRWKRLLLIVAASVVGIYVVWLAGTTWFVRDGIYRINTAQKYVTFSMGPAVAWWPGRLSGRDLRVVVHDSDVELDMHFDSFSLDVDVRQLAEKRFVTTATKLDGVTFYFRETRPLAKLCATKGLPPITGQADSTKADCMAQDDTALPDQGGDNKDVWRLDLAGIELTDVRDLWLEDLRVQGHGSVDGRFYLWPGEELDIATQAAHWTDAIITIGADTPLAAVKSLDAATVMRDMEVPKHRIWEEFVSADLTASGVVLQLSSIGAQGTATGQLEAHMRDGVATGASVVAHSDDFAVDCSGRKLAGVLDARLRVDGEDQPLRIREALATLRNVKVDGKAYDNATLEVKTMPGARFDARTGATSAELIATGKSARPVLALLPSTFGAVVAGIVMGPDAPINGSAKLSGGLNKLVFEPLTVQGGALEIAGRLAVFPRLKADLVASVGPLHKTVTVE